MELLPRTKVVTPDSNSTRLVDRPGRHGLHEVVLLCSAIQDVVVIHHMSLTLVLELY